MTAGHGGRTSQFELSWSRPRLLHVRFNFDNNRQPSKADSCTAAKSGTRKENLVPTGLIAKPHPQLEIGERQMLQGILRLIAELRPQLSGGPVQVGSSSKLMSVNKF
jgi:hypothetical protein